MERKTQQTIALAGITQAAYLVHQLAHQGIVAQEKLDTSIDSLFVSNPKTVLDVYGGSHKIRLGLQILDEILGGGSGFLKHSEVIRYILGLLNLASRLSNHSRKIDAIGLEIDAIEETYDKDTEGNHNFAVNAEVIRQLSDVYQKNISTLGFRIQVKGEMKLLQNPQNANKIRAILLAGIRSTVLWNQLGGRRWQLLFNRAHIRRDIIYLLTNG